MPGLDGEDGTSGGEENGVGEQGSTTEVGADTNVLNNTGGRCHGCNIGEGRGEVELAVGDGGFTEGLQSSLEDDGVGSLILLDVDELLNGEVGAGEAGSNKVGLLELGNCLLVEGRLELFEDIGKLEHQDVFSSTLPV